MFGLRLWRGSAPFPVTGEHLSHRGHTYCKPELAQRWPSATSPLLFLSCFRGRGAYVATAWRRRLRGKAARCAAGLRSQLLVPRKLMVGQKLIGTTVCKLVDCRDLAACFPSQLHQLPQLRLSLRPHMTGVLTKGEAAGGEGRPRPPARRLLVTAISGGGGTLSPACSTALAGERSSWPLHYTSASAR